MLEAVASDYLAGAGAVVVGVDAEGFQQAGQLFGVHGFAFVPFVPGAVIHSVEKRQQVGGGDPLGIAFLCEGVSEVGEDLPGTVEVFEGSESKGVDGVRAWERRRCASRRRRREG